MRRNRQTLRGSDVCIAFECSEPGLIPPAWIRPIAPDAIVFACDNPEPEVEPENAFALDPGSWPPDAAIIQIG